jgi:MauM/NapG family ferredoxin protein
MCLDCLTACRTDEAMRLAPQAQAGPWRDYDPARRELLTGAATGIGAVVLLGTGWWQKAAPAQAIRPPGVHDEAAFNSACARCGECLNVCPTSGLQPALSEAGLAALWTPVLKPRMGYCAWQCTACGEICPTGAIPRLRLGTKRREVLGTAVIDRNRCLPWSQGKPCVVCQEVCPVPHNAVHLGGGKLIELPDGSKSYIVFPTVLADRCVGCGICEFQCPVKGVAAIQVWPASRAPQAKKSQAPG